jgi:hypothetical protein
MLRRDYILRMVEEFFRTLSKITRQKEEGRWDDAEASLEEEAKRLIDCDLRSVCELSDSELLGRLLQTGEFQSYREKSFMLVRVLMEAAEVADSSGVPDSGHARCFRLKALHLLLSTVLRGEIDEWPEFVPKLDVLLTSLGADSLSVESQLLLMQYFERSGQFAKAEDALFRILDLAGGNAAAKELGISFYHRVLDKVDGVLDSGGLPREEVESALNRLQKESK